MRSLPTACWISGTLQKAKTTWSGVRNASQNVPRSNLPSTGGRALGLPPVAIPEESVVPIESLLYRGRAALDRAAEIRDQVRRAGARIDDETLDELFDLVELARSE